MARRPAALPRVMRLVPQVFRSMAVELRLPLSIARVRQVFRLTAVHRRHPAVIRAIRADRPDRVAIRVILEEFLAARWALAFPGLKLPSRLKCL